MNIRHLIGLVAIALFALMTPYGAGASKPTPIPPGTSAGSIEPGDLPPNGSCDFPIDFYIASGKAGGQALPGNRVISTSPGLFVTVVNRTSGHQVTSNATGSFHIVTLANGNQQYVVTGRNILSDPIAGVVLAVGNFTFTQDPTGSTNVVPLSGTGTLTNICTLVS